MRLLTLLIFVGWQAAAPASDAWMLLPEPKFMANEIVWAIPGSAQTVLLPARWTEDGDILPLTPQEAVVRTDLDAAELRQQAAQFAADLLDKIEPILVRDENQVIHFAVLESESPPAAACVVAPGFRGKFLETIGPDPLIIIPTRSLVYVFPRAAVPATDLDERIFIDYQTSNYPVSREILDPAQDGLRAIGTLR